MTQKYRLLALDLDGTLTNSKPLPMGIDKACPFLCCWRS